MSLTFILFHFILFYFQTRRGKDEERGFFLPSLFYIFWNSFFNSQFFFKMKERERKEDEGERKNSFHPNSTCMSNGFDQFSSRILSLFSFFLFILSPFKLLFPFQSSISLGLKVFWILGIEKEEERKKWGRKKRGREGRIEGYLLCQKYCNAWISNTSVDPQSISSLSLSLFSLSFSPSYILSFSSREILSSFIPPKWYSLLTNSHLNLEVDSLFLQTFSCSFSSPFLHLHPSLNILLLSPSSNFVFKISILIPSKRNWPLFLSKQFSHCLFLFWIRHRIGDPICFFFLSSFFSLFLLQKSRRAETEEIAFPNFFLI